MFKKNTKKPIHTPKILISGRSEAAVLYNRPQVEVTRGWFYYLTILVAVFDIIGVSIYLHSVNADAAKGYEIRELSKELETLRTENRSLNYQAAENASLTQIQENLKTGSFIPVTEKEYIVVGNLTQ